MPLNSLIRKWRMRTQRRRLIRQDLKAFAEIDPDLYSDIGLFPQNFHEQAERSADRRLRMCCAH
ncbi:hypothetical protein [Roseinatronobacter sp. S2]|uniref:hypothetical protein n=1 Tax=Roseinatronobacter sp. S2 TaxID=3035471 RepID=UPI00240F6312|nr:hypothetical protein [Roseinatronobacter sp. S2]WFE77040.1 hypothetical protein P8S53_20110 [Roseinatronobacter sp. S2]